MQIRNLEITGLSGLPQGNTSFDLGRINIFTGKNTDSMQAFFRGLSLLFAQDFPNENDFAQRDQALTVTVRIAFPEISGSALEKLLLPDLFHLLQVSADGELFCTLRFSSRLENDHISCRRQWLLPGDLTLCADSWNHIHLFTAIDGFLNVSDAKPGLSILFINAPETQLTQIQISALTDLIRQSDKYSDRQIIINTNSIEILRSTLPETIRYFDINTNLTALSDILPGNQESTATMRQLLIDYPEIYTARLLIFTNCDNAAMVLPRLSQALGVDWQKNQVVIVPVHAAHIGICRFICHELHLPSLILLNNFSGIGAVAENMDELFTLMQTTDLDTEQWPKQLETDLGIYVSPAENFDKSIFMAFPEFYCTLLSRSALLDQERALTLDDCFSEIFKPGENSVIHRLVLNKIPPEILRENCPAPYRALIADSVKLLKKI